MSFPYLAALSDRAVNEEYVSTKTFPIGMKGMTEDGSTFRLCLLGGADAASHLNAYYNGNRFLGPASSAGEAFEGALSTAIADGDKSVIIVDATGDRVADYYKGGYVIQPRGLGDNIRRIWKSDAEDSDKYTAHVTAPFTLADAVGNTIHFYPSPWNNVKPARTAGLSGNEHYVGWLNITPTSGYYCWVKVTGPHWCQYTAVGGSNWPGVIAFDRTLSIHTDGAVTPFDRHAITSTTSPQFAGYLMYSGNYGDVMTMLQVE